MHYRLTNCQKIEHSLSSGRIVRGRDHGAGDSESDAKRMRTRMNQPWGYPHIQSCDWTPSAEPLCKAKVGLISEPIQASLKNAKYLSFVNKLK